MQFLRNVVRRLSGQQLASENKRLRAECAGLQAREQL